jgi:hypothetical protein
VFTPSIVPSPPETVYLVEDDFGRRGRSYREIFSATADRETTIRDLLSGQYEDPVRVVAFNTREGWSRDVSHELAVEVQRRDDIEGQELTATVAAFVETYTSPACQLSLRLA